MNTDEQQPKKRELFSWFKFYPSDWLDVLTMTEIDAGKRFKTMITRLSSNKAPEGSIEKSMIDESKYFSDKQRERVMKRWNKNKAEPLPRNKQEVIEYAEDNSLDVDDALEWAQINLKDRGGKDKDGNPIRNWKMACSAYCAAMRNKRNS